MTLEGGAWGRRGGGSTKGLLLDFLMILPHGGPGLLFSGRRGSGYPLLVGKGGKKGQRNDKFSIEAVWKEPS